MIVTWFFWSLASVVLMLRLVAAIAFVNQLRPSEYLMMAAYLCATVQNALITISLRNGLGCHIWFLQPDQVDVSLRFNCYTQGWSIATASLARISCCVFLLGFVSQFQRHRWSLWTLLILQIVLGMYIIIVIYASPQTTPFVVLLIATYIQCGVGTLTDVYLAIIPCFIFWSLQMPLLQKVGLVTLFSCSIFAVAASVVKLSLAHRLGTFDDLTWNLVGMTVWVVLEGYVIIICGSIPMLRPFVRLVRPGIYQQDALANNAGDSSGAKRYTVDNRTTGT